MPPKVLLVDDVNMFLEIQKGFLKLSSVHILTARDGAEALAAVKKERPELVFMDLHMPNMDGAECCASIKADPELSRLPVIMLTAEGKEEDRERCIRAGCDDFLTKPIDRVDYLQKARKYLPAIDRRDPRVPCRTKVMFRAFGVSLSGETVNVSARGVYIAAEYEVAAGTVVEMVFVLPGEESGGVIQVKGRVAWVNSAQKRLQRMLPVGFGVEFTGATEASLASLKRFVERHA
jgi:uncharacterized protein (TIGR02266 family)